MKLGQKNIDDNPRQRHQTLSVIKSRNDATALLDDNQRLPKTPGQRKLTPLLAISSPIKVNNSQSTTVMKSTTSKENITNWCNFSCAHNHDASYRFNARIYLLKSAVVNPKTKFFFMKYWLRLDTYHVFVFIFVSPSTHPPHLLHPEFYLPPTLFSLPLFRFPLLSVRDLVRKSVSFDEFWSVNSTTTQVIILNFYTVIKFISEI